MLSDKFQNNILTTSLSFRSLSPPNRFCWLQIDIIFFNFWCWSFSVFFNILRFRSNWLFLRLLNGNHLPSFHLNSLSFTLNVDCLRKYTQYISLGIVTVWKVLFYIDEDLRSIFHQLFFLLIFHFVKKNVPHFLLIAERLPKFIIIQCLFFSTTFLSSIFFLTYEN